MRQTLLIAEADAELRLAYQRIFSERGYIVETASDGLGCLEKLRRVRPSVLVLDRELHWGGGDGILAWLREESGASGLSVILTSARKHAGDGADHPGPPVVKFLAKPFAPTTLLESVRAAVAGTETEVPFYLDCRNTCSEQYLG